MQRNERLQLEGDCAFLAVWVGPGRSQAGAYVCVTVMKGLFGTVEKGTGHGTWRGQREQTHQQMLKEWGHDKDYWHWEEKRGKREVPD